ncbi:hypothetical protein PAHAL_9G550100 [Panicum hallii]|uniref:Protein kinase domain-containing protein n=1 Tax=Panicum hallii TaxID=206008 RepID=A0A2T8I5S4_9POAL|nr:hypothetical protein PAHAL_9G550100 [Panicum hallii]
MVATRMVSSVAALLLLIVTLASAPSVHGANGWALSSCQATCGGVAIPYPFGIGANLRLPIAWTCYDRSGKRLPESEAPVFFNPQGVYRISDERNQLVVVGCDVTAYIQSRHDSSSDAGYPYQYYTDCVSYCRRAEVVRDGRCAGVGCCRVDIPPNLTDNSVGVDDDDMESTAVRRLIYDFNPCSYGFLVERGSYKFRAADLKMDRKQTMPAFNCSDAMKNSSLYACKSQHSSCVDAVNGPGYTCNCSQGYEGHAYIVGGGTDIDECLHPCYGVCHNTQGSYDCKCKRGSHGNPRQQACNPNFSLAAKISIGVICGISCLIALSIFGCVWFSPFILMLNEKRKVQVLFERNGGPLLASINNIKIYTKQELTHITRNFSTVIGKGSVGEVYKGTTNNNQTVAVKAISVKSANEVIIQSRISHRNTFRLLGCCLEVDVPMLVYDFAPKGSPYYGLHGTKDITKTSLSLATRLDIEVDSTEALSYVHSSTNQKILHGDVKSGSILLDENFMPKVSDFGTTRLLSIEKKHTILVIGNINYIDPVYMKTGRLDEKSDVYSFGVVLLELITRKKPRYDGNKSLIINFIKSYASEDKAREMFDEEIASPENIEFLQKVGSIAVMCLKEDMDDRPTMKQVAEHLQLVRREWKQRQGRHGDQIVDVISMESPPVSLTIDASGAESPGYSPLLK